MNQSQFEYQVNHQEKSNAQENNKFFFRGSVLVGTLVLIMSTNTWWFGG
jgi:hypothetical protein